MFIYPKQAEFNRPIPKTKIYGNTKVSRSLKDKFVQEVGKFVWRYKLSPETTNLSASRNIQEIQVFDVHLKEEKLSEDVLRTIDKVIVHPVFYQLHFGEKVRFATAYKRPHESDSNKWVVGEYFFTKWEINFTPSEALPLSLDLKALWEFMLRAHVAIPVKEDESLPQQIERISLIRQKEREAQKLESKINKEKQFNKKVELNRALKSLNTEIQQLRET